MDNRELLAQKLYSIMGWRQIWPYPPILNLLRIRRKDASERVAREILKLIGKQ